MYHVLHLAVSSRLDHDLAFGEELNFNLFGYLLSTFISQGFWCKMYQTIALWLVYYLEESLGYKGTIANFLLPRE